MNTARRWVVIDGYSLVHRNEAAAAAQRAGRLAEARRRVIARLERIAPQLGARVTLVFDGQGPAGRTDDEAAGPVEVRFTPSDRSADAAIERLARECAADTPMLVVTSDRLERTAAEAAGADTMGCGDFWEWCERIERDLSAAARRSAGAAPRVTLGMIVHLDRPS